MRDAVLFSAAPALCHTRIYSCPDAFALKTNVHPIEVLTPFSATARSHASDCTAVVDDVDDVTNIERRPVAFDANSANAITRYVPDPCDVPESVAQALLATEIVLDEAVVTVPVLYSLFICVYHGTSYFAVALVAESEIHSHSGSRDE